MKKLAMLLIVLPLAALADVAPMSREEWERSRQFVRQISIDDMSSTDAGYAGYMLAGLMGVWFSVWVFVLEKERFQRGDAWRKTMKWGILTAFILAGCLWVEFLFCPWSMVLDMVNRRNIEANGRSVEHNEPFLPHDETYEQYLFYQKHCRKCGTALIYDCGRRCPECHPRSVSIGQ